MGSVLRAVAPLLLFGLAEEVAPEPNGSAAEMTPLAAAKALCKQAPDTPGCKEGVPCVTRADPRATSRFADTPPPGTACVFGLDPRDEGKHCVLDGGKYGSLGWCWTDANKKSSGSCSETCPLFGPEKILEDRLNELEKKIDMAVAVRANTTETATTTENTTAVDNATIDDLLNQTLQDASNDTNLTIVPSDSPGRWLAPVRAPAGAHAKPGTKMGGAGAPAPAPAPKTGGPGVPAPAPAPKTGGPAGGADAGKKAGGPAGGADPGKKTGGPAGGPAGA